MPLSALFRESWVNARSRPVFFLVFFSIAALASFAVILQFAHAQNRNIEILAEMEAEEYRTVTVSAGQESFFFPVELIEVLGSLETIEALWAMSSPFDVENPVVPQLGRVSAVYVFGSVDTMPVELAFGRMPKGPDEAVLPVAYYRRLGFDASGGVIEASTGEQWAVVGAYNPHHRRGPMGAMIFPESSGVHVSDASGNTIERQRRRALFKYLSMQVRSTQDIDEAARIAISLAKVKHSDSVTIDKANDIKRLSEKLNLSQNNYTLAAILGTLVLAFLTLAFMALLMVNSRRREFGRRRVLGATRLAIVLLLITESAMVLSVAIACGVALGISAAFLFFPLGVPSVRFILAVFVLMLVGTLLVQLPSAIVAALRDPVRVLRTP